MINDINANIKKYELIKINNKKEELTIDGIKINNVNNNEGNRFLGIFFRHDNRRKVYKGKIRKIIDNVRKLCS